MEIVIKTISAESQRYPTIGDYWYDESDVLQIRITETGNEFYEKMIAIHELIEEALTKKRGLTDPEITNFDLYYEKRREQGLVLPDSEPGFCNEAPYLKEHTLATSVEMMMCALTGESWIDYENAINNL
jgi:hypothetical protein